MHCFVCDCSDSLMLSQLNATKLNKIMPTSKRIQSPAKRLVMFCNVPEKVINNVTFSSSCSLVKLKEIRQFGFELYQNAFGGRAPPGPAGGAIAIFNLQSTPVDTLPQGLVWKNPNGGSFRHNSNVTDRDTDRWTPHGGIGRACIASRGNVHTKTCIKLKMHSHKCSTRRQSIQKYSAHDPATNLLDFLGMGLKLTKG